MTRGMFIVIDGGDGTGKTTQVELLCKHLTDLGRDVVNTREPGGTPEAEKLRDLIVRKSGGDWLPKTEMMLLFAGRYQHTETLIKPAIAAGKTVVSSRFDFSTYVYQGISRGVGRDAFFEIQKFTLGDFHPDLVIVLDNDPRIGLTRARKTYGSHLSDGEKEDDRFEGLDLEFHDKVRAGYLEIAKLKSDYAVVVDASGDVDNVAEAVWKIVEQRINERG